MSDSSELFRPYADLALAYAAAHPGCNPMDALEAAVPKEERADDWEQVSAQWRALLNAPVDSDRHE